MRSCGCAKAEKKNKKNYNRSTVFENHRKVSFNIASEASYVFILSGQKFIKNAKKKFGEFFENPEACSQTVLPDRSLLIGQKLVENAKCDILGDFQTL